MARGRKREVDVSDEMDVEEKSSTGTVAENTAEVIDDVEGVRDGADLPAPFADGKWVVATNRKEVMSVFEVTDALRFGKNKLHDGRKAVVIVDGSIDREKVGQILELLSSV